MDEAIVRAMAETIAQLDEMASRAKADEATMRRRARTLRDASRRLRRACESLGIAVVIDNRDSERSQSVAAGSAGSP